MLVCLLREPEARHVLACHFSGRWGKLLHYSVSPEGTADGSAAVLTRLNFVFVLCCERKKQAREFKVNSLA